MGPNGFGQEPEAGTEDSRLRRKDRELKFSEKPMVLRARKTDGE